jgi:hypothetical protein
MGPHARFFSVPFPRTLVTTLIPALAQVRHYSGAANKAVPTVVSRPCAGLCSLEPLFMHCPDGCADETADGLRSYKCMHVRARAAVWYLLKTPLLRFIYVWLFSLMDLSKKPLKWPQDNVLVPAQRQKRARVASPDRPKRVCQPQARLSQPHVRRQAEASRALKPSNSWLQNKHHPNIGVVESSG